MLVHGGMNTGVAMAEKGRHTRWICVEDGEARWSRAWRGIFSGVFPAACLCSGEMRRAAARAMVFRARRRGGNERRKKRTSPSPLFIGEAW